MKRVRVTIGAAEVLADVKLASPNGRSLFVEFDGAIAIDAHSTAVGALALLRQDDGRWIEIVTGVEVGVTDMDPERSA